MILIISQYSDYATTQVINWLLYYKKKFVRINGDGCYHFLEISPENIIVEINYNHYNLLECNKYWYRRDGISSFQLSTNIEQISNRSDILQCIKYSIKNEIEIIKSHIYNKIENKIGFKNCIGNYATRGVNKLDVLDKAKDCGLMIPRSVITTTKKKLEKILEEGKLVTKAASECIYDSDENNRYVSYTNEINPESLNLLPSTFMASLFQENIVKKYELRIFYLKGNFYPSVVFSQESKSGKIDCRRNSNCRYLPYKLPKEIMGKLNKLMKLLKLNTGSIDMIVDHNNNYIFLEVNPVGQFVAYGEFCNYYLDREMAKIL